MFSLFWLIQSKNNPLGVKVMKHMLARPIKTSGSEAKKSSSWEEPLLMSEMAGRKNLRNKMENKKKQSIYLWRKVSSPPFPPFQEFNT